MSEKTTQDQPIAVNEPFIVGPQVKTMYQDISYKLSLQLGAAVYFNSTNLLIGLYNKRNLTTQQIHGELSISKLNASIETDGSYNLTAGDFLQSCRVSPTYEQAYDYFSLTTAIVGDSLYIFVLFPDQQTVAPIKVSSPDSGDDLTMERIDKVVLKHKALSLATVVQGAEIYFYYPIEGQNPTLAMEKFKIDTSEATTSYSLTDATSFELGGGPVGGLKAITSSEALVDGSFCMITDQNNDRWSFVIKGTSSKQLLNLGTLDNLVGPDFPSSVAANGPALSLNPEASNLIFQAPIGGTNAITYTQCELSNSAITNLPKVMGTDAPSPITSLFAADLYIPLPGSGNSLFRMAVVGAVALEIHAMQLYAMPTGSMIAQTPITTDTSNIGSLENEYPEATKEQIDATIKSYFQSYSLLWIIQSPPPFPYNGQTLIPTEIEPKIDIELTSSDTIGTKQTFENSYTAGASGSGEMIHLGGSVTHAIKSENSVSYDLTLSSILSIPSGVSANSIRKGYLIFNQPTIKNHRFDLYSPDGTNTDYSFYMIKVTSSSLIAKEYDPTNPSEKIYAKGLPTTPAINDIVAWKNPAVNLDSLQLALFQMTNCSGSTGESPTSIVSAKKTISTNSSSKNKVKIDAGLNIGIFGFKASTDIDWSTSSNTKTSISKGITVKLPQIPLPNEPTDQDVSSYTLKPLIYQLKIGENINRNGVLPDLYQGANPFIISWRVDPTIGMYGSSH